MSIELNGTSGIQFNDGSDQSTAATPYGRKNLIINGDMRIAQRGTSLTGLTSGNNFTSDRFKFQVGAGTWSQTTDTDVPTGQGFVNSLKINCTATATPTGGQSINFSQGIEGLNLQHLKYGTANAEQLTLSFWVKSNKTGTYVVWFYQNDDARQTNKTYTIDTANTWEKKTITISADTVGVLDNDNGQSMLVRWVLATGPDLSSGTSPDGTWEAYTGANAYAGQAVNLADSTSNYINITGCQLEIGDAASDFEFMPYDMELARCMRYYEKFGWRQEDTPGSTSGYNGAIAGPTMGNITTASLGMMWKVIKRARPTVTAYGSIGGGPETAGILVDWNFGTTCGTATVFRVEDCGYNYISAPTATSYGHIYRIVANAEL